MPALRLQDVRFRYAGSSAWALDGVSLDVEKGEFVTLLGANASGKSTLCMLCNGLVPHAIHGALEGTVQVFDKNIRTTSTAELATKVGLVFQEPESQLISMSVEEEVAFGPENLAIPREEIRERVEWALETVGLKGFNERSPSTLSGGQKQRVAIAATLSMHPEMLVLDEPAYALDPVGRSELYKVLRDLRDKRGLTVLLAERDAEEAAMLSDRIVLMSGGKIVDKGPPSEMLRRPERLRPLGLDPPQMTVVANLLNQRLGRTDLNFIDVSTAERAISELIRQSPKKQSRGRNK